MLLPERTLTLKAIVLQKTPGSRARLKGLGVLVSLAIAAVAIFALMHALRNVDYDEVFAVVRHTDPGVIAVACSTSLFRKSSAIGACNSSREFDEHTAPWL